MYKHYFNLILILSNKRRSGKQIRTINIYKETLNTLLKRLLTLTLQRTQQKESF